jgi:hypothetical protein
LGLFVLNSATAATDVHHGGVAVCGSHAGRYPAYLLARAGLRGVALSDAGFGLDRAGVAGLDDLDAVGIPAIAIAHDSARIGDGADMLKRGRVSAVNAAAAALGCTVGQACADAVRWLARAGPPSRPPEPLEEMRHPLPSEGVDVWALDSIALVRQSDVGAIIVSGSHGGLIGPARSAVKVDVCAAIFHDAGVGCDEAGLSRLPALDSLGIAGAVVDGDSARIGDALSVWRTGRLSGHNRIAQSWGARKGMTTQQFVAIASRRCSAPTSPHGSTDARRSARG